MNKKGIIIFSVILVIVLGYFINTYNNFQVLDEKVSSNWAQVENQLKRRNDLIPNLINAVKGYSKHEKEIFTQVTKLRNQAQKATTTKDKVDCANKILPYMNTMVALAEGYPELQSSPLYKTLMDQLVDVEDKIVAARRIYNSNVNEYNSALETFPTSCIAHSFNFKRAELFQIDASEAVNPRVNLGE